MEHKVLLSVAITFILFQCAHSLKCYKCTSREPDRTCASPLDTSKVESEVCNKTTLNRNSPFGSETDVILKAADNTTEFQCIVYEKFFFHDNKSQTVRGCMPKYENYCRVLNQTAESEQSHNLTKCYTCTTDNCNSSTTNSQISAFLCIFGLILGGTFM